MSTRQYGAVSPYRPGELATAMQELGALLEEQFPGRSAFWIHAAPTETSTDGVGFVSWRLKSDTLPVGGETEWIGTMKLVSQAKPTSL